MSWKILHEKPMVSRWNCTQIAISHIVLAGKSDPSTFLTSVRNLHKVKIKLSGMIISLSCKLHAINSNPIFCLYQGVKHSYFSYFFLFFSLNSFFSYFFLFFSLNSYFFYFFQILWLSLGMGMQVSSMSGAWPLCT